ncbi:Hypothetical_protein [Hexamita inflata]|uniref:Hypothetical_protein n=1 Tax=Hexamita inflata TaxID=28002 RepID=A0ABP1JVB3_9EUKA
MSLSRPAGFQKLIISKNIIISNVAAKSSILFFWSCLLCLQLLKLDSSGTAFNIFKSGETKIFSNFYVWMSLSRPAGFQKLIISKNIIISNVAAKSSILFFWNCLLCLQLLKLDSSGTAFNIFKSGETKIFSNISVWTSLPRPAGFQKIIISENIIISNVAAKSSILCFWNCLLCLQLLKLDSSGTAFNIFKSGETKIFSNFYVWTSLPRPAGFQKLIISKNIIISNVAAKSSILFFWNCLLCLQLLKLDSSGTAFNIFKSGETKIFSNFYVWMSLSRPAGFQKLIISKNIIISNVAAKSSILFFWNCLLCLQLLKLDSSGTAFNIFKSGETKIFSNFYVWTSLPRPAGFQKLIISKNIIISNVAAKSSILFFWNCLLCLQLLKLDSSGTAFNIFKSGETKIFSNFYVWTSLPRPAGFQKLIISKNIIISNVAAKSSILFFWNCLLCLQLLKLDSSGTAFNIFKSGETKIFSNFYVWTSLPRPAGFQKLIISKNIIISNVAAKSSILFFWSCLLCLQLLKLDSSGTAFNIFKSGETKIFSNNSVWISLPRPAGFQKLIISKNIIISNVAAKSSILFFWSCLLCLQLLKLDSSGTAFNIFKSGETKIFSNISVWISLPRPAGFQKIIISKNIIISNVAAKSSILQTQVLLQTQQYNIVSLAVDT